MPPTEGGPTSARADVSDIQIPARYAINAYMRELRKADEVKRKDPGYWINVIERLVDAGRANGDALVEALRSSCDARVVVSIDRTDSRRLGKPVTLVDLITMRPETLVRVGGDDEMEIIVMRRRRLEGRGATIDATDANTGFAIARHAMERLYERERVDHVGIGAWIRGCVAEYAHHAAFMDAALLMKGTRLDTAEQAMLRPGSVGLVPFGPGLLLTQTIRIDMQVPSNVCGRYVMRRGGNQERSANTTPQREWPIDPVDGKAMVGRLMTVGVTYVSHDLMRPGQVRLRELFLQECARHARVDVMAHIGRVNGDHERPARPIDITVPDELRGLLHQEVRRDRTPSSWRLKGR